MEIMLIYNQKVIVLKRHNDNIFRNYNFPEQWSAVGVKAVDYFNYIWETDMKNKQQVCIELAESVSETIKGKLATVSYETRTWMEKDFYVYTITYANAGKLILDVKDNVIAIYERKCGIITTVQFSRSGWKNVLVLPELDWKVPQIILDNY